MKALAKGPFRGLVVLHGPQDDAWMCVFCVESKEMRDNTHDHRVQTRSNLYKHMNTYHSIKMADADKFRDIACEFVTQLRAAFQDRNVRRAEEVWDKMRRNPMLKAHVVPSKTADKHAWVDKARKRLIILTRAGGPTWLPEREASDADAGVGRAPAPMPSHALRPERRAQRGDRDREGGLALPQEHDDGDGDADADAAGVPTPPPRRRASRGRPVAVDDHHVIDLTLDSEPEARPRARNPRSASPPRRRAQLLPTGLQPPAGEPMMMREFCERYHVDPHVRDVLVAAGWAHSHTLEHLRYRELTKLNLNVGEVVQLRSAVERWAVPAPG